MRLALHEPDIAGNVGTLIRTATCFGVAVDLIEPMGFPYSDRALARSAMDYAALAEVVRHADWDAFRAAAARPSLPKGRWCRRAARRSAFAP